MLSIIVAMSKNNVIGKDNQLIWHISEDLKNFKRLTTGHTIIMGRNTFESLGRVLPNRKHIVFSRDINYQIKDANVKVVHDIAEIEKYINSNEEAFVIGGEAIYRLLLPYVNKMYITYIDEKFDGDTYFPEIDYSKWNVIDKKEKTEDNKLNYYFITYEKTTIITA